MIKKTLLLALIAICSLVIGITSASASPVAPNSNMQTLQADDTKKCDDGKEDETAKCDDGKDKEATKCGDGKEKEKCGAGKCG